MKRLMPAAVALLVLVAILPAIPATKLRHLRKRAGREAREHFEEAYNFYKQAYDLKPKDLRYKSSFERLRFKAAATIVHQGQKLREDGKLQEALATFKSGTDRSVLFIAQQELKRTLQMINEKENPPPQGGASGQFAAQDQRSGRAGGAGADLGCAHHRKTHRGFQGYLSDDRAVAGINVLFDPDYTSRRIKVELNGVTLEDALQITALESKTFGVGDQQYDFCRPG